MGKPTGNVLVHIAETFNGTFLVSHVARRLGLLLAPLLGPDFSQMAFFLGNQYVHGDPSCYRMMYLHSSQSLRKRRGSLFQHFLEGLVTE